MKSFCEILRELREDRDMTQADVANLLGTSQQYYSKYETGKYEMPIHYVVPLADFYGVSVELSPGAHGLPGTPGGISKANRRRVHGRRVAGGCTDA